jgi:Zn-finger nucleic acid-binding protein
MCPVCREPLVAFQLEGVEVDHCVSCEGTWLDSGELQQIVELAGAEAGRLSQTLSHSRQGRRTRRRCPRCPHKLREIELGRDPAAVIDRCPGGHGLWFDRGEMLTVVRSFAGGEEGEVARFFGDLFRSELEASQPRGD